MPNKKSYSTTAVFKRFFVFAKPYKRFLVIFLVFSFISTIISLSEGFLVKNIVNLAVKKVAGEIKFYIILMLLIIVFGALVNYYMKFYYGKFTTETMKDFRTFFFKHFQGFPAKYFENMHSGDLLSRSSNDANYIQRFFGSDLLNLFTDSIMFIAAAAYMASMNWKLLLFSIMISPPALLIVNFEASYAKRCNKKSLELLGTSYVVIQDAVNGIIMVKSFNLQKEVIKRFSEKTDLCVKYYIKATIANVAVAPLNVVLRMLPTILCITYGGYLTLNKILSPGELMAFIYLLNYVTIPLASLPDKINALKGAAGSSERVLEILDMKCEREDGADIENYNDLNAVEFKTVGFAYKEGDPIFKDLSFSIEKGKSVAIVGPSGCGKSTLLKLICGFQTSDNGEIKVFNKSLSTCKLDDLRAHISLVTQDTYLFPESVLENIACGRQGASMEEIIEATKIANAYNFIMELPQGFQTFVGERGVRLSGGQKQRIALARAILKDAPILLLDEPTSALDTESEALVQEALDVMMRDKTSIIIAHRYSTIKNVDEILVLDNGEICERGTHNELMNLNGCYRQLYEKQFINKTMSEVNKDEI